MNEIVLAASLSASSHWYNVKLFEITKEFGSLTELYKLWRTPSSNIPEVLQKILLTAWSEDSLTKMSHLLEMHTTHALLYNDDDFPAVLKEIPDPPYVLYVQGNIDVFTSHRLIGCVGTRTMSTYGARAVRTLLPPLQLHSLAIVSGLALGIDAEVHRTALDNNVPTIAVIGGGLDRFEPLTNAKLGERIARSTCVMSEYPPGVRPQKHHFLERNRIIAGLSEAIIVIEGKLQSGALVTARYALQYGRDVGVVPGDIFSPLSAGPNSLLCDGAWPITSAESIQAMLGLEAATAQVREPKNAVHAVLQGNSVTFDSLVTALGLPVSNVQQQLLELELDGLIGKTTIGEYYAIT